MFVKCWVGHLLRIRMEREHLLRTETADNQRSGSAENVLYCRPLTSELDCLRYAHRGRTDFTERRESQRFTPPLKQSKLLRNSEYRREMNG